VTWMSLLFVISSAFAADRIPATLATGFEIASLANGSNWTKVAQVPLGKSAKTVYCKLGTGCELRGPKGNATPLAFNVKENGIAFRRGEGLDALKLGERVLFLGTDKPQLLDAFRALETLKLPGV